MTNQAMRRFRSEDHPSLRLMTRSGVLGLIEALQAVNDAMARRTRHRRR
jgi:hypothetical protein